MRKWIADSTLTCLAFAALGLAACASPSSGTGSGGGAAGADSAAAGDGSIGSGDASADAGAIKDGTAADGAKTGDGAASDGGSSSDTAVASADLPVQDTGRSKDDIAKNLAEVAKAEQEIYKAYCKWNFKCDTGMPYTNVEACAAELIASGGLEFMASGKKAVASGTAKFKSIEVSSCLSTFDDKCTFFKSPRLHPFCESMFYGLISDGFACIQDQSCTSGHCKRKEINDEQCPGLCASPGLPGAKCVNDAGCDMNFICRSDGECGSASPAQKGADCTDVDCVDGLNCLEDGGSYTCFEPKAEGAACWVDEYACKDTAYCLTTDTESEGKCKAKVAAGKPCDKDGWYDGLSENPCVKDYVCVELSANATSAVCAPIVPVGQPCAASDQCKGYDEVCDGAAGKEVCTYLPKKGEACDPLDEELVDAGFLACLPPFVCDAKSSKCIDLPPVGKPCAEFYKCAADLYCNDTDTCAAPGKPGEDCVAFDEGGSTCDTGLICGAKNEKCVAPVCK